MINIDLINGAPKLITNAHIVVMMSAFQKYIDNYLIPAWQFDPVTLHIVLHGHKANPGHWWMVFNTHSDQPGALGYHDVQPNGLPYARIFVGDDLKYGASISVTATHELAEMLGDPNVDSLVDIGDGKLAAKELCDAVEDDIQAINIDGVACSNFVLPAYFQPNSIGPWDYQHLLHGACPALTPGGYMELYYDGQWHQLTARLADGSRSYRSNRTGRTTGD